jgi:hypothetical protein
MAWTRARASCIGYSTHSKESSNSVVFTKILALYEIDHNEIEQGLSIALERGKRSQLKYVAGGST